VAAAGFQPASRLKGGCSQDWLPTVFFKGTAAVQALALRLIADRLEHAEALPPHGQSTNIMRRFAQIQ
jgi:hypothetical protein